ncbi:MAG: hypothetical protein EOM83_11550 [Clostridia bacterium]|nr:hypothetical protein [Clostridia bacterium]
MAVLGTKMFWKAAPGASASQKENQILKNSGYINLQLLSVNYMSSGNFWQNIFGGSDKIALATSLKYQTGTDSIEATVVQDVRQVPSNRNYNLGLQRNVAVKIPANADAISVEVKITAVKNDQLQARFDMLNEPEYQTALQLAPTIVGQIITVTSLVKKLFTQAGPTAQLEASYAGIISLQAQDHPVAKGKLTRGLLIIISTNEGDTFAQVDESLFEVRGVALYYRNRLVENTYVIFNISFESLKGADEKSIWFRKYNQALNVLDKIVTAENEEEIKRIYNDSKTLWIEGNALLDADDTYINMEKLKIKASAIDQINDKYREYSQSFKGYADMPAGDILSGLRLGTSIRNFEEALPETGSLLNSLNISVPQLDAASIDFDLSQDQLMKVLKADSTNYLKELKLSNNSFRLRGE